MVFVVIKMANIKLVPIECRHARARYEALSNPVVAAGVFIDIPVSFQGTLEWCKTAIHRNERYDFCVEIDGEAAGFCGLVNVNERSGTCELYLFLHPSSFGKGFGSKSLQCILAFAKYELNLRKVTIFVTDGNERAFLLYKKFGFVEEGHLVDHVWFRGRYRDRYLFSIFLEDFRVNREAFYEDSI